MSWENLLTTGGTASEKELLAQFSTGFVGLQRIDANLLSLAVKNTNIKAYNLAFGPAAAALEEENAALAHLATAHVDASEARTMMPLAFGARDQRAPHPDLVAAAHR